MSKFKIGDRVRVVSNVYGYTSCIGAIGDVIKFDNEDDTYSIQVSDMNLWIHEDELELHIEPKAKIPASEVEGKVFRSPKDEEECELYRKWFKENTEVLVRNDLHNSSPDNWNNSTVGGWTLQFTTDHSKPFINIDSYIYSKPSETVKPSVSVKTVILQTFTQAIETVLNRSDLIAMRRDGIQFMARNGEGVVCWYAISTWSGKWVEAYPVKVSSRNNKDQFEMINRSEFFKSKGNV